MFEFSGLIRTEGRCLIYMWDMRTYISFFLLFYTLCGFVCYRFVILLCDEMNNLFLTNVKDQFNDAENNLMWVRKYSKKNTKKE